MGGAVKVAPLMRQTFRPIFTAPKLIPNSLYTLYDIMYHFCPGIWAMHIGLDVSHWSYPRSILLRDLFQPFEI